MARYRKIDPRVWNDGKFRSLSDNGKLAFLFILTHPSMTSLGAMRATLVGLAAELGWPEKAFGEAFREASNLGMLEADEKASYVGAPNFVKYNAPESPNVVRAWRDAVGLIPECDLLTKQIARVKAFVEASSEAFREAFREAFSKATPQPSPNQEQEQEQEQDIPPTPRKRGAEGAQAQVESDARRDARNWITANHPQHLKPSHIGAFERLIVAAGKEEAIRLVEEAMTKGAGNPFAYALQVQTSEKAQQSIDERAADVKPVTNWKEGVLPDGRKPKLTFPAKATVGR